MKLFKYSSLLTFLITISCSTAYKFEPILIKGKAYYYQALYIDSIGDTITNEILIMKPLNRRWLGQLRIQESIKYHYNTNSDEFKNFISPDPNMKKISDEYFNKHGENKIKKIEITGGVNNEDYFFLHPPRSNQYYMLRYSAYPYVKYSKLTDSVTNYNFNLREIMKYNHVYNVSPFLIKNSNEKLWKLEVESKISNLSEYWQSYHIFNSKSVLIFSKERGFIKMHHTFENGIKIQFDLIEIKQL